MTPDCRFSRPNGRYIRYRPLPASRPVTIPTPRGGSKKLHKCYG
jgi:hypothetical protein